MKTVPDSTKLRLIKVPKSNFLEEHALEPPSFLHALHTDTYLPPPPNNPYNLIFSPHPLRQKAGSYSCYSPILSPCSSIDSVGVYANMQFYYKYEGWILLLSTLAPGYQSCSVCSQLGVWLTYIYALKSIVQIFVTLRNANIRCLPLPPTLLPLLLLALFLSPPFPPPPPPSPTLPPPPPT